MEKKKKKQRLDLSCGCGLRSITQKKLVKLSQIEKIFLFEMLDCLENRKSSFLTLFYTSNRSHCILFVHVQV